MSGRFPAEPGSVALARRLVRDAVAGEDELVVAAVVLAANELVTNVLLHAGTDFTVSVGRRHRTVRVEVADGDPRLPPADPAAEVAGWGTALVARVTDRRGAEWRDGGKVVWFEVGLGPTP